MNYCGSFEVDAGTYATAKALISAELQRTDMGTGDGEKKTLFYHELILLARSIEKYFLRAENGQHGLLGTTGWDETTSFRPGLDWEQHEDVCSLRCLAYKRTYAKSSKPFTKDDVSGSRLGQKRKRT